MIENFDENLKNKEVSENNAIADSVLSGMNPMKLAFLGDAVYELYVRRFLVLEKNQKIGELNKLKAKISSCDGQFKFLKFVFNNLSQEEKRIYKFGSNAKIRNFSRKLDFSHYRCATGLECLLGYLYLKNREKRIGEILSEIDVVLKNTC